MEAQRVHPRRDVPRGADRAGGRHDRTQHAAGRGDSAAGHARLLAQPRLPVHPQLRQDGGGLDTGDFTALT